MECEERCVRATVSGPESNRTKPEHFHRIKPLRFEKMWDRGIVCYDTMLGGNGQYQCCKSKKKPVEVKVPLRAMTDTVADLDILVGDAHEHAMRCGLSVAAANKKTAHGVVCGRV